MDQKMQQQQKALNCPRCDSTNTKFCYYNNYSLSQPRHFCKACKRYWTRGGTLRTVPVGGGCRKNKRVRRAPAPALQRNSAQSEAFFVNDVAISTSNNIQVSNHQQINSSRAPMFFEANGASLNTAGFDDLVQQHQQPNGAGVFSDINSNAAAFLSNYSSLFVAPSSASATQTPMMISIPAQNQTIQQTRRNQASDDVSEIKLEDTDAQKWNKNNKIVDYFHHPDPSHQYDLQINQPYDHTSVYWNVNANVDLLPPYHHHHHHQSSMDGSSNSSVPSLI